MPCRPAESDLSLQIGHGSRAARLLIWASETLERDPPIWAFDLANDIPSRDERPTVALCRLLRELPDDRRAWLLDRQHGYRALELTQWWTRHQRADAERESA
ncbi:MAG: hypothetical protein AAGL49_07865 [Pseudomonadota bacterium]